MKEYLSKKQVPYQEKDVSNDREAIIEMMEKSKQMGVPVVIIDDKEIIIGFDQAQLDKLLVEKPKR